MSPAAILTGSLPVYLWLWQVVRIKHGALAKCRMKCAIGYRGRERGRIDWERGREMERKERQGLHQTGLHLRPSQLSVFWTEKRTQRMDVTLSPNPSKLNCKSELQDTMQPTENVHHHMLKYRTVVPFFPLWLKDEHLVVHHAFQNGTLTTHCCHGRVASVVVSWLSGMALR